MASLVGVSGALNSYAGPTVLQLPGMNPAAQQSTDILLYRGTSGFYQVQVMTGPVVSDLTDCRLQFMAKLSYDDLDSAAIINKDSLVGEVNAPTPTNGVVLISLTPTDTSPAGYTYPMLLVYAFKVYAPGQGDALPVLGRLVLLDSPIMGI